MRTTRAILVLIAGLASWGANSPAVADSITETKGDAPVARGVVAEQAPDVRQAVDMPPMMVQHMLGNMRDHLAALAEAQRLAAEEKWDLAAEVVESRIGMSSMERHGAAHMAAQMPPEMRALGTEMHQAASRAARALAEADPLGALSGLSEVMTRCHACHSAFRLR